MTKAEWDGNKYPSFVVNACIYDKCYLSNLIDYVIMINCLIKVSAA